MKNKLLCILLSLFFLSPSYGEVRTWTDSKSGKTIKATFISVSDDGSKVTLKRDDLKMFTMDVNLLMQEDQDFISEAAVKLAVDKEKTLSEPGRIELKAKSVAYGKTSTAWSNSWVKDESAGFNAGTSSKDASRIVGIYLNTPRKSHGGDYVVEIFWFGFPKAKKTKRYICAYANDIVSVPAHSEVTIAASSSYSHKLSSLDYGDETSGWKRLYTSSWYGYEYAGWVVRVSDGKGKLLQTHGAQPTFARHIEDVPIPVKK